jgi:hypothetical protein
MDQFEALQISEEIYNQMGGIRSICLMTGAKHFKYGTNTKDEVWTSFKFQGSDKVNYVKITLTVEDLYEVEFEKISKVKGIPVYDKKSITGGIYNEDLKDYFEKYTGLYLTLFP